MRRFTAPAFIALALALVLGAFASPVIGAKVAAQDETTTTSLQPDGDEPVPAEVEGVQIAQDAEPVWFVGSSGLCAPEERTQPQEIDQSQVVCAMDFVADPAPERLTPGSALDGGITPLSVIPVVWTDENIVAGAPASFETINGRVELLVVPAVSLDVSFRQASGDSGELLDPEAEATPETSADPTESDDPEMPQGVIDDAGITKVVTLSGEDLSGVANLEVREQIDSNLLVASIGDALIEPDNGTILVAIRSGERTVTYKLALAPGANFGIENVEQVTELVLNGERIVESDPKPVQLAAPSVTISATVSGIAETGSRSLIEITVRNGRDAAPARPLAIMVEPVEGSGAIESVSGISDGGQSSESTVTWTVPEGLESDSSVTRTFLAAFTDAAVDANVRWAVTVAQGDDELARDDSLIVQVGGTVETASPIDFTPGQLIRLIAFVIAFAMMAVIFGAWVRNRQSVSGASEERLKYELDVFRTFTQAVIVIVILVGILVLALQGGLAGESAASLIGVVAGYVLGQSVSR